MSTPTTPVFCRINGQLARFQVGTDNHAQAIAAVQTELARARTPADGPVLALIEGDKE